MLPTVSPAVDLALHRQSQRVAVRPFRRGDLLDALSRLHVDFLWRGLVVGVSQTQPAVAPLPTGADGAISVDDEGAVLARLQLKVKGNYNIV